MKAADPDTESKPVSIAGFRNCGDDVPTSFAINANNAISLPTALQRHLPCHALTRAPCIASKVTTNLAAELAPSTAALVMTLSRVFVSVAESRVTRQMIRIFASKISRGAFIGSAFRRLNFKHGTWRIRKSRCKQLRIRKAPASRAARPTVCARLASALIIPNFDRALHTLTAHLICARLRD